MSPVTITEGLFVIPVADLDLLSGVPDQAERRSGLVERLRDESLSPDGRDALVREIQGTERLERVRDAVLQRLHEAASAAAGGAHLVVRAGPSTVGMLAWRSTDGSGGQADRGAGGWPEPVAEVGAEVDAALSRALGEAL